MDYIGMQQIGLHWTAPMFSLIFIRFSLIFICCFLAFLCVRLISNESQWFSMISHCFHCFSLIIMSFHYILLIASGFLAFGAMDCHTIGCIAMERSAMESNFWSAMQWSVGDRRMMDNIGTQDDGLH